MEEIKVEIKTGDIVKRYRGGSNAGKKVGEPWIVSRVTAAGHFEDENGNAHDKSNVELVKSKDSVNNTYQIF